jgi:hypothetical protein
MLRNNARNRIRAKERIPIRILDAHRHGSGTLDLVVLQLLLILWLQFLELLLLHHHHMRRLVRRRHRHRGSGRCRRGGVRRLSIATPTAGGVGLDVSAELVAVDELLVADVALEVLHAEVYGAGVDGQPVLAVESLPAVVAHKPGVVLMLSQMGLYSKAENHKVNI